MSEENKTNGDGNKEDKVQINVLGQYIKDLSFENPNSPDSLRDPGKNPNLNINFNVGANSIGDDTFEVTLHFDGTAKSETTHIYTLELVYAGVFRLTNVPDEAKRPLLLIDCPALLFPFARRMISDLTREGGFPPLLIDPIDFAALYRQNMVQKEHEEHAETS